MPRPMVLDPQKRETLLEWARSYADFTINDLQAHFDVHYQTAWGYLAALRDEGLVEKTGMRRAKRDVWRAREVEDGDGSFGALRVQIGGQPFAVADWASARRGAPNVAHVAMGMCYLYVRSYYADAPSFQHLRGRVGAAQVRAIVVEQLKRIEQDVAVIKQLLTYRGPWEEGSVLAQRFGDLPVGTSMQDLLDAAALFDRRWGPKAEEVEGPPASSAPQVSAVEAMKRMQQVGPDVTQPPQVGPHLRAVSEVEPPNFS